MQPCPSTCHTALPLHLPYSTAPPPAIQYCPCRTALPLYLPSPFLIRPRLAQHRQWSRVDGSRTLTLLCPALSGAVRSRYKDWDNAQVLTKVQAGQTAEKPTGCGLKEYALMKQCWAMEPSERYAPILSHCGVVTACMRRCCCSVVDQNTGSRNFSACCT